MIFLLFLILAGCAVKCDDANNYYVIEMPDDPPIRETKKSFKVYWNVPTMQCTSKKIPFENLFEKYGILQNEGDSFRGDKIAIIYDPGLFPALLKNETSGKFRFRNGGVPQEGNLDKHLRRFKSELEHSIPDEDFDGVGIIDFESWRPVFRQNFGVLVPYKDISYEIEKKRHWWWPTAWIDAEAKQRFEEYARKFMQTTLSVAKQIRPKALWGYYAFPYCFNMASNNMRENCANKVPMENDQIYWLWSESSALYPSVYSSSDLTSLQLAGLVRGRVSEAARVMRPGTVILPYFWFQYREGGFFSQMDLSVVLETLYNSKANGFIIWGSSNDVNTVDKCSKLLEYVDNVLGPAVSKYTKANSKLDVLFENALVGNPINNVSETSTSNPIVMNGSTENILNETRKKIVLDPEYHWEPPANYTQDIVQYVHEEFMNSENNTSTINEKNLFLQNINDSVLINLILNNLLDKKNNLSYSEAKKALEKNVGKDLKNETITLANNAFTDESLETTTIIVNSLSTKNPFSAIFNHLTGQGNPNLTTTTEQKVEETESSTSTINNNESTQKLDFNDKIQFYNEDTLFNPNLPIAITSTTTENIELKDDTYNKDFHFNTDITTEEKSNYYTLLENTTAKDTLSESTTVGAVYINTVQESTTEINQEAEESAFIELIHLDSNTSPESEITNNTTTKEINLETSESTTEINDSETTEPNEYVENTFYEEMNTEFSEDYIFADNTSETNATTTTESPTTQMLVTAE